jgi:hypothetical protein
MGDEHYTPAWVFERMGIEFDLDVCSPAGGLPWIPARRFYTSADDGLSLPWEGRVWMNPPYSRATPWVRKFVEHANGVCLVPHAKSIWFFDLWASKAAMAQTPRRVIFVSAVGSGDVLLPTVFAAFGEECIEAISRLGVVRQAA